MEDISIILGFSDGGLRRIRSKMEAMVWIGEGSLDPNPGAVDHWIQIIGRSE